MSDYGHEQTDKELKRIENLISKEYSQAAKELEDKMLKQFESFNARDVKMRAKLKAGEITQTEYNNWLYNQVATGDRWRSLRDSMVNTLVDTDKAATTIIQGNSIKAYADNMNYSTYKIEHDSKINTGFTLYDENTVINLLKEDPKIIPMPKVDIPKDELWNRQHLTSAVTQGILQGESIPQIADRLQNVAFMGRNSAIRNARTYTTAAENKGRIDSYERAEKLGIQTNKKWIATLDEKTRAEHRHLDGMSVPYKEDFKVDGYTISFPGDPSAEPEMFYNCRCTLVDDIVGYPYNDERKDDKLGDMTYEEWKHAKDKEPKEEINGESAKEGKLEFIPAKSITEAQEYAQNFSNFVDYKGLSLDKANIINEQLTDLYNKYPINKLENIDLKERRAIASANYNVLHINKSKMGKALEQSHELFMQSKKDAEDQIKYWQDKYPNKIPKDIQKIVDKYENIAKFTRFAVLEGSNNNEIQIKIAITHEYGHIIADQYFGQVNELKVNDKAMDPENALLRKQWDDIFKKAKNDGSIYEISQYSSTHRDEFFAECFAAREFGEWVPDYVEEFMEEVFKHGLM